MLLHCVLVCHFRSRQNYLDFYHCNITNKTKYQGTWMLFHSPINTNTASNKHFHFLLLPPLGSIYNKKGRIRMIWSTYSWTLYFDLHWRPQQRRPKKDSTDLTQNWHSSQLVWLPLAVPVTSTSPAISQTFFAIISKSFIARIWIQKKSENCPCLTLRTKQLTDEISKQRCR